MGHIINHAIPITHFKVGMMPFRVSNPGDGVDKAHGAIKASELKLPTDPFAIIANIAAASSVRVELPPHPPILM